MVHSTLLDSAAPLSMHSLLRRVSHAQLTEYPYFCTLTADSVVALVELDRLTYTAGKPSVQCGLQNENVRTPRPIASWQVRKRPVTFSLQYSQRNIESAKDHT